MKSIELISKSSLDTEKIGNKFSETLKGNEVIALYGGLGMGKTTLVRGIASGLNLEDEVSSPTFSLINEYDGKKFNIYHFDMYRVHTYDDLYSTGFFDYLENGVLIIEWSENIEDFLPENKITINIKKEEEDNTRKIIFKGSENLIESIRN